MCIFWEPGPKPKKIEEPKKQVKRGERGEKKREGKKKEKEGAKQTVFMASKIFNFLAVEPHKSGSRKGETNFGFQGPQLFCSQST